MRVHRTPQRGFFTIVPNATARDHGLSFTARGLLAFLISLPDGAREDVKTLANKSVEGRSAISKALSELETRGYLVRTTSRDDAGRIRTHVAVFDTRDGASAEVGPATVPPGTGSPGGGKTGSNPEDVVLEKSLPPLADDDPDDVGTPGRVGGEPSRAEVLLAGLGRADPRLHLSTAEGVELAPLVEEWLARGTSPTHVTSALTSGLPGRVHHAASLIRHRLAAKMPAETPPSAPRATCHECEQCRAPIPATGWCSDCAGAAAPADSGRFAAVTRSGASLVRDQLHQVLSRPKLGQRVGNRMAVG